MQEVFKLPYEMYTWGEIYSHITKDILGLCINMKVHNSVNKLSHLPDRKSVCEKYGLYITDPMKRKKKKLKEYREKKRSKYKPKTHYYEPEDIKLKTHTHQARQQIQCWICGKTEHIASNTPESKSSRTSKGTYSEQRAKEAQQKQNQQLAL